MPYSENNVQGIVTENDMTEKKVILTIKVKKPKKSALVRATRSNVKTPTLSLLMESRLHPPPPPPHAP